MERERKFLVADHRIIDGLPKTRFLQGYIAVTRAVELRIRTGPAGQALTVKAAAAPSVESGRPEIRLEENFPLQQRELAYPLIEACNGRVLVKTRYVKHEAIDDDHTDVWTIDEYHGDNRGLLLAEFEYPLEVSTVAALHVPSWVGREVTGEARFYGQNLSVYPVREWSQDERQDLV